MKTQEEIILDKLKRIHPQLVRVEMDFRQGESVIVFNEGHDMYRSEFKVDSETYSLLEEWETLRL